MLAIGRASAWWDSGATTLREVALIPQASRSLDGQPYGELPSVACSDGARYRYGISEKPVFFGHYGMPGLITVLGPNTACLDFSAGNPDAPLVAYRFDGDRTLERRWTGLVPEMKGPSQRAARTASARRWNRSDVFAGPPHRPYWPIASSGAALNTEPGVSVLSGSESRGP